jgi:hypothetical protein
MIPGGQDPARGRLVSCFSARGDEWPPQMPVKYGRIEGDPDVAAPRRT